MKTNKLHLLSIATCYLIVTLWSDTRCMEQRGNDEPTINNQAGFIPKRSITAFVKETAPNDSKVPRTTSSSPKTGLESLSKEILITYIIPDHDSTLLQVNRYFFTLITGYSQNQIFCQGFGYLPASIPCPNIKGRKIRFIDIELDTFRERIPSFIWHSRIKVASNVPFEYWDDLDKTLIHTLELSGIELGNIGTQALARALVQNTTLTSLSLGWNRIGDLGAKAIACNTILKVLDLQYNKVEDAGAQALSRNTTLLSLNLFSDPDSRGNKITDKGAQALALNTTLTFLDLGYNHIGDIGVQALANNTTLTTLILYGNQLNSRYGNQSYIGKIGAQALALNTTLTFLNLSCTWIGDVGAQALASNTTLTNLEMGNNQISDVGAQALALNTTLTSLSLGSNKVSDVGAQALASNTTLTNLEMGNNQISDAAKELLRRNTHLKDLKM